MEHLRRVTMRVDIYIGTLRWLYGLFGAFSLFSYLSVFRIIVT